MLAKFYINMSYVFFHSQDPKLTGFPDVPGKGKEGRKEHPHALYSGTLGM